MVSRIDLLERIGLPHSPQTRGTPSDHAENQPASIRYIFTSREAVIQMETRPLVPFSSMCYEFRNVGAPPHTRFVAS